MDEVAADVVADPFVEDGAEEVAELEGFDGPGGDFGVGGEDFERAGGSAQGELVRRRASTPEPPALGLPMRSTRGMNCMKPEPISLRKW